MAEQVKNTWPRVEEIERRSRGRRLQDDFETRLLAIYLVGWVDRGQD